MSAAPAASVVEDVACTVCGCVCDDLRVHVAEGRIERVDNDCPLARPWFAAVAAIERADAAAAVDGAAASFAAAVASAAAILKAAKAPLIYGLSRSSTGGQRAACALADRLGATIDTTASVCHAPSIMALQVAGESTSTLGEIRHRSDLVIYWGSDPVNSHPRHIERYSVDASAMFIAGGRRARTLVVVDIAETSTAQLADVFIKLTPGSDFDALWALRCLVGGIEPSPESAVNLPLEQLRDLALRMKACQGGAVYFGRGLARRGHGHANVEALLRLVTDLNKFTRFYARRMRVWGDVAGADSVLCWQTGYPFSVNLARGYPRYSPGEYSADELLSRGEVDACLLVGSDGIEPLSAAAQERLRHIPTVVLDYPHVRSPIAASVQFTTAIYGIHRPGTAYRMDEVPIPLKTVLLSELPSDEEVLGALLSALG